MLIQCGLLENSILTVTDCWGLLLERQVEKPKNNVLLDVKNEINGMSLGKLQETVKDRQAWRAAVHGFEDSQTRLSDWTTTTIHTHRTHDNHHNSRELYWVKKKNPKHPILHGSISIIFLKWWMIKEMENRFMLSGLQGCGAGVGEMQGQPQKTMGRTVLWTDGLSLDGIPASCLWYWGLEKHHHWESLGRGMAVSLCHFLRLLWTYNYVKAKILTLLSCTLTKCGTQDLRLHGSTRDL